MQLGVPIFGVGARAGFVEGHELKNAAPIRLEGRCLDSSHRCDYVICLHWNRNPAYSVRGRRYES